MRVSGRAAPVIERQEEPLNVTLRRAALAAGIALSATSFAARAGILPQYPTTTAGPSSTAWYPDRFPPSAFDNIGTQHGRANVLGLSIAGTDVQSPPGSGSFTNTQGRKVDTGALTSTVSWIGSLYIPSSWGSPSGANGSLNRRADLWATVAPATGGDTCDTAACDLFPIIDFTNGLYPDTNDSLGGTPRYRVFDTNEGWVDLATPVSYDTWTDFCVTFTGSAFQFYIGDTLVYTQSDLEQGDTSFGPVTNLANVMVQSYNYGYDYQAQWSQVATARGTCANARALFAPVTTVATPVPAIGPGGLAVMMLALAFAGALSARRRALPQR